MSPYVEKPEPVALESIDGSQTTATPLSTADQLIHNIDAAQQKLRDQAPTVEIQHALETKFGALHKEAKALKGETEEKQREVATEIQAEIERILKIQITTHGEHGEQDRPEAAKEIYDLPPYLEGCFSLLDDPKINWPGWGKDDDVSQEEAVIKQQLLEFQKDPAIQQFFKEKADAAALAEEEQESDPESLENPFWNAIQAWLENYAYGVKASGESMFGNYFTTKEVEELNDTLENEADKIREQAKVKEEKARADAEAAKAAQKPPEAEKPAAPQDKYKEGWSKAEKVSSATHQQDTSAKVNVASGHLNLRDDGDGHPKAWLRKDQEVTILANQEQKVNGVTFVKVSVSSSDGKPATEGWASLKYLRLESAEAKQEAQTADVPISETGGAEQRQRRIPREHPRHIEA